MNTTPIVLVPGFWLGAWAWDEVADALRADGHDVTALTLPGLESVDADRSSITLADHVDAICEAVTAAGRPVVLAVHSGAGFARLCRHRPDSGADRGHGLRRHRPGGRRARPRLRDAEHPLPSPAHRGGEPRRAQRGAARDLPSARASPSPAALREAAELRTTHASTCRPRSSARGSPPSSTRRR